MNKFLVLLYHLDENDNPFKTLIGHTVFDEFMDYNDAVEKAASHFQDKFKLNNKYHIFVFPISTATRISISIIEKAVIEKHHASMIEEYIPPSEFEKRDIPAYDLILAYGNCDEFGNDGRDGSTP